MIAQRAIVRGPDGTFGDPSRWIGPIMQARRCDADFALPVLRSYIAPICRAFPSAMANEPAPADVRASVFGGEAPERTWWECVAKALLDPDFHVRIYDGNIAFTHTLRPAPKRFVIAKYKLKKVDDHFRLKLARHVLAGFVMEQVDGHWRLKESA